LAATSLHHIKSYGRLLYGCGVQPLIENLMGSISYLLSVWQNYGSSEKIVFLPVDGPVYRRAVNRKKLCS
jgi:hypothetical protein